MRKRQQKKNSLNRMVHAKRVLKTLCKELSLNWQQELKYLQFVDTQNWDPSNRSKGLLDVGPWAQLQSSIVGNAYGFGLLAFIDGRIAPPYFVWGPEELKSMKDFSVATWKKLPLKVRKKRDLMVVL